MGVPSAVSCMDRTLRKSAHSQKETWHFELPGGGHHRRTKNRRVTNWIQAKERSWDLVGKSTTKEGIYSVDRAKGRREKALV